MACIRKDIIIDCSAVDVWSAVAAVGAIHERLAPGFVVDTQMDGDTRIVTFDNDAVARELIVDVDGASRRVAYAVIDSPLGMRHHHASMQVFEEMEGRCRLVWIADVAPDAAAPVIDGMMRQGATTMQCWLSGARR
jgi:Polyketide cyclase / dehydrase and lipid transport